MAEFKVCNFCGKGENTTGAMFTAGSTNICDECIIYCYEQLFGAEFAKAKRNGSRSSGKVNAKAAK